MRFYISKVFQNAIFLFFIYNDIVLFYAYPVFYKRLAVYLGGRSNGLPTMPLLSAYLNSSSQLNHTPNFRVRQLNCVKLHCQDLLGDNPERLFLGKLRLGSMPSLSFGPLVA